ncbi:MAG TPA: hypothetical protein PK165_08000 [bacterium]|nr:hypothetical protein [bacterium]HOL50228.1 hypothetical protein [bacterium]HPO52756.1 hypothetical protein [bacterium]
MKRNLKCSMCGKAVCLDEVFAFYPEDDSLICKNCFGASTISPNKKPVLQKRVCKYVD